MSKRSWLSFLTDIHVCSIKILEYTKDVTREDFFADSKTFDAVIRNLQIIGEAAKKIPPDIRRQCKTVEWKKLAGLRDIVIHDYFGINEDIVWDVITSRMPLLAQEIGNIIDEIRMQKSL